MDNKSHKIEAVSSKMSVEWQHMLFMIKDFYKGVSVFIGI